MLAVNAGAATAPEASAPTMTVFDPLVENTPLAPLEGALNVTGIPAAALVTGTILGAYRFDHFKPSDAPVVPRRLSLAGTGEPPADAVRTPRGIG